MDNVVKTEMQDLWDHQELQECLERVDNLECQEHLVRKKERSHSIRQNLQDYPDLMANIVNVHQERLVSTNRPLMRLNQHPMIIHQLAW